MHFLQKPCHVPWSGTIPPLPLREASAIPNMPGCHRVSHLATWGVSSLLFGITGAEGALKQWGPNTSHEIAASSEV